MSRTMIRRGWHRSFLFTFILLCSGLSYAQVTPVLSSISPDAATPQVTAIFINGTDLIQDGYTTTVTFNGVTVPPQDILAVSPEQLVVLAPAMATSGPVTVSIDGDVSNTIEFQVVAGDYVPDELMVELYPGVSEGHLLSATGLELREVIPLGEVTHYRLGLVNGGTIAEAIRALFATGLTRNAFPNFIYETTSLPSQHNQPAPNDTHFAAGQYGPQRIRAVDGRDGLDAQGNVDNNEVKTPDAHRLARGTDVTIAVVDTGIDYTHEDLAGKVIKGTNFTVPQNDPARNDPLDKHSHGTHVAGIAAAITNNGKGIAGVAPEAKLLAVKVLGYEGRGSYAQIAAGISSAAKGANVINMSLAGGHPAGMEAVVNDAWNQGRVLVAAAGNQVCNPSGAHDNWPCYPAAFQNVIAVAGTNEMDGLYTSSTQGSYVDVAAPGVSVLSTISPGALPDNFNNNTGARDRLALSTACQNTGVAYCEFTGTSMASPHVAAVAALMLEIDPTLTPTQVQCLLETSAVDLGTKAGKDPEFGSGRVDAYAAVLSVLALNRDPERKKLLPRECNRWKPVSLKPPAGGGGGGLPPPPVPPVPPIIPIPVPYPIPPGLIPGIAHHDQIIGMSSDSHTAFAAVEEGDIQKTIRVDLASQTVTSFAGAPLSDVVLTPDDQYALASEFAGDAIEGKLRRIDLSTNGEETLALKPPVTEITVTADSRKALVGTREHLVAVDLLNFTLSGITKLDVDVITGISTTQDSIKALVGEPVGVALIDLASNTISRIATGIPITGIAITPDGSKGVVGVQEGVAVIDISGATSVHVAGGTPVSNIAISADGQKAVYAKLSGIEIVNLNTLATQFVATSIPVSDVDLTSDSQLAVVGTKSGVSIVDLATATATHLALLTPLQTGMSLSADNRWGTVGVPNGVALVDLTSRTATVVSTARPVTGIAMTGNSSTGVVGTLTGAALIDLKTKTATALSMSRALVAPTVSDDNKRAIIGTKTGVTLIDIANATSMEVSATPPVLNLLPDSGQPPLNPSGERGAKGAGDG